MSSAAAHESKRVRHACERCHGRKARFRYRGAVRADHCHTLCFECYRSELNRVRAKRAADECPTTLSNRFENQEPLSLTGTQIAHRQKMLAYLRAETRSARN